MTLKALGHKSGLTDSPVGSAVYTIAGGGSSFPNGYTYRRAVTTEHLGRLFGFLGALISVVVFNVILSAGPCLFLWWLECRMGPRN